MKVFYLAICALALSINGHAQVYMNVTPGQEKPSAILQVDSSTKGVSLPNVALTSTGDNTTVTSPKEGLLVYNTNTSGDVKPGYYYRYNNAWQPMGKITDIYIFQQKIDLEVLGYIPDNTGITLDNSAGSVGSSVGTWNKAGCVKWDVTAGGNGHTYCTYKRGATSTTWEDAFTFAKERGGYPVTITSDAERNWLQTNVITPKSLAANIWLGYNKYQSRYIPLAGNNNDAPFATYRYKWITGEKWVVNWEAPAGAVVQSNFATGEPSIVASNGCAYIMSSATNAARQWNDNNGASISGANDLIVEFQDTY